MLTPGARIGKAVEETPERTPESKEPAVAPPPVAHRTANPAASAKPRRKRTWYSIADVLLRRLALAAFIVIALVATIVAAVGGR